MAAKAAVDKAKLDLEFTKIVSPIDGIAGIAKAQIGNLVGPGASEELTTVSTVNPIKVNIQISEQDYMRAMEKYLTTNNTKSITRGLELIIADGSIYPHKGDFAFADRKVDIKTGTITVTTIFPNPNNLLRPGQFAKIRNLSNIKKNSLLIPQRAVTELQGKYLVAVVGDDNKVSIRLVKVGEKVAREWIIDEGLKSGEKVVAEGIQKVRDGIVVTPKPFVLDEDKKSAPTQSETSKQRKGN